MVHALLQGKTLSINYVMDLAANRIVYPLKYHIILFYGTLRYEQSGKIKFSCMEGARAHAFTLFLFISIYIIFVYMHVDLNILDIL